VVEDIKDLNDVRVPYVFRKFPMHVHKWAGAYEDGGHKPNKHREVVDDEDLAAALKAGWSINPVLDPPKDAKDAAVVAKARAAAADQAAALADENAGGDANAGSGSGDANAGSGNAPKPKPSRKKADKK
jgi:hypothetical protein